MKKSVLKRIVVCLVVLIVVTIQSSNIVNASSGKLRSDSICQDANGVYYGQHSSDNHWHRAVYHDGSGWYPNGGVVSGNPCAAQTKVDTQIDDSSSTSTSNNDVSSSNNTSNNDVSSSNNTSNNDISSSNNVSNSAINAESNSISKEDEEKNIKPEINAKSKVDLTSTDIKEGLDKEDIIELFEVEVVDEKEIIDDSKVTIKPNSISSGFIGTKDITISYEDAGGLKASKKVQLTVVKSDTSPVINTNIIGGEISINISETPQNIDELIQLIELEIIDAEDGVIDVTEDNISIDEEEEILTITATDSDGNTVDEKIQYNIGSSVNWGVLIIIIVILILGTCGFVGLAIYMHLSSQKKLMNKKKNLEK